MTPSISRKALGDLRQLGHPGGMGGGDPGVRCLSHPGLPHHLGTDCPLVLADGPRATKRESPMHTTSTTECRCKLCQALLAKRESAGLSIRRGDLQATVMGGDFTVAVLCYRCKTLNVLASAAPRAPGRAPSAAIHCAAAL